MTRIPASFVVDASAASKQFLIEPEQDAFLEWITTIRKSAALLLAPHLLRFELGNIMATLVRRGEDWPPEERRAVLGDALLGFRFIDPDGAEEHSPRLSFYDASYLALAIATGSVLVTYDGGMAREARDHGVGVLVPGR